MVHCILTHTDPGIVECLSEYVTQDTQTHAVSGKSSTRNSDIQKQLRLSMGLLDMKDFHCTCSFGILASQAT